MKTYTNILLSDRAFIGIVLSTIEVYKAECLGVLLGYNTKGRIIVEHAIPYQAAKRKPTRVEPNLYRSTAVLDAVTKLTQLQHVGFFHSHTQWGEGRAILSTSRANLLSKLDEKYENLQNKLSKNIGKLEKKEESLLAKEEIQENQLVQGNMATIETRMKHVESMGQWSFSFSAVLKLLAAAAVPLLTALLQFAASGFLGAVNANLESNRFVGMGHMKNGFLSRK